ncbi:MAG: nuclear transport factor 2 family protein [Gammaproteobacteria bacterium]|nr:nuclear transport factor 2 family protein [Gammaproteobacteria bacterium]
MDHPFTDVCVLDTRIHANDPPPTAVRINVHQHQPDRELKMATDMITVSENLRAALLKDFKDFYRHPSLAALENIDRIYTQDVEFRDPVHAIHGRLGVKNYLRGLYAGSNDMHFEYLDEHVADNTATIVWQMTFSHKKLKSGKPIEVRGITLVRFTDRIYYHEDFFDLGAMLYQHVPVLGSVIRTINNRLSA